MKKTVDYDLSYAVRTYVCIALMMNVLRFL